MPERSPNYAPRPQRSAVTTLVAGLLGGLLGPTVLTWVAWLDHLRKYHSGAEFWGEFVTVPAGLLYGPVLAIGLAAWTRRVSGSGRGTLAWSALAVVLFFSALLGLLRIIYWVGTKVTPDWGYPALLLLWLVLLGLVIALSR